jgi:predicted dehydrogenase
MIKIGVVGCGYWGPNLIRNFNGLENAEFVYICDLNEERLVDFRKTYPMIKSTTNYDDLLKDSSVDAICIATPVFTHFPLAKKALDHKKHVLIEKPLTLNSEDALKLINLAEKNNLKLMVGHTFEYAPAVRMIKALINKNTLGKIFYMTLPP